MLPIRNRSCGVIGVRSSSAAAAISASIVSREPRGPRGRRMRRSSVRRRDSDPPPFLGWSSAGWPPLLGGSVSLIYRRSGFACSHSIAIGVWHPQNLQYLDFPRLHRRGLGVALVIETQEMQYAVDCQVAQMIGHRLPLLGRLARDRFDGEDNIAEQHWNVRRLAG